MGAMSQIEFLTSKLPKNDRLYEVAKGAYNDCKRVSKIVEGLLGYKPQISLDPVGDSCDLNKVLDELKARYQDSETSL